MRLDIVAAGFSGEEANQLRRAMAIFRHLGTIGSFRDKFVTGMTRRGYDPDFAQRCFQMIEGFGDYGFPESHAASFAHLVYVSAWMKWAYPDVFACALLNAQPMGFYAPAQIVRDARDHGVEVRPVDVNDSFWDNTLEALGGGQHALRLGFRQVSGFQQTAAERIVAARGNGYPSIEDVQRRSGISHACLEVLAAADAFRSIGLDRRQALWQVRGLAKGPALPLFDHVESDGQGHDPQVALSAMAASEQVIADYQTLHLSLKAHPVAFLRQAYKEKGILAAADLLEAKDGARVRLAGVVLVRQRPGTASGVIFMTIEDETGVANLIIWPKVMDKFRTTVMGAKLVEVTGRVQKADGVIHIIATSLKDQSQALIALMNGRHDLPEETAPHPTHMSPARHPRNARIIPAPRDFH